MMIGSSTKLDHACNKAQLAGFVFILLYLFYSVNTEEVTVDVEDPNVIDPSFFSE